MTEEGPCFGFKKKTVVMTSIGLCCLALVIWTILVTGGLPGSVEEEPPTPALPTDTEFLEICPLNSSVPLSKLSLVLTAPTNSSKPAKKSKDISRPNATEALCKCVCQQEVTDLNILEALRRKPRKGSVKSKPTN